MEGKKEDVLSRRNSTSVKIEKYGGCSRNNQYSRTQKWRGYLLFICLFIITVLVRKLVIESDRNPMQTGSSKQKKVSCTISYNSEAHGYLQTQLDPGPPIIYDQNSLSFLSALLSFVLNSTSGRKTTQPFQVFIYPISGQWTWLYNHLLRGQWRHFGIFWRIVLFSFWEHDSTALPYGPFEV